MREIRTSGLMRGEWRVPTRHSPTLLYSRENSLDLALPAHCSARIHESLRAPYGILFASGVRPIGAYLATAIRCRKDT